MAEIKLQRTAYRFRSRSALYIKLSPLFLIGLLAALFKPELYLKLKLAWFDSITLTEVEPDKYELSSLKDINFIFFLKNLNINSSDLLFILLFLFTIVYLVVLLSCVWLKSFKLRFFYHRCNFKEGTQMFGEFVKQYATHMLVNEFVMDSTCMETVNRRTDSLLPLYRTGFIFYIHDYKKFVFNTSKNRFDPVEHIDDIEVSKVRKWQGLVSTCEGKQEVTGLESNLNVCADLYGPNDYEIPRCNFWKMLMEAFLAPFFVFQVTSTLFWIFDDYLYYSLISIASMVLIEVQMVYKRIMEYNRINSMTLPPYYVYVYRDYKWQQTLTKTLYPGDIILLTTNLTGGPSTTEKGTKTKQTKTTGTENILICPCDCLILEGEVIVDESILTGESIPQFKTSAEDQSKNQRNSTIFSGTYILLTRNTNLTMSNGTVEGYKKITIPKTMEKVVNEGCICMVTRTGFESYQGRLVHSIINSDPNRMVNNNKQGYAFLLLLLVFALAAVWVVATKSHYSSIKKLLLVSSRILVSVIPPEFPVTLSMAVTIGLIQLRRKGIYCTEPNRLPLAATIDVIAFDKTGTLTQDKMYLNGIYYTNSYENYLNNTNKEEKEEQKSLENLKENPEVEVMHKYSRIVISGCHSLTLVNEVVTGDPMEKIPFNYFKNQIDKKNNNMIYVNFNEEKEEKGNIVFKIIKRWRFTSELGRMSVLGQITTNKSEVEKNKTNIKDETLLLVKGSPEKIKQLLRIVPVYFDKVCHELTIKGLRVLCLAYKNLYDLPAPALMTLDRNLVEKDLEFCGFIALEAPIKSSSRTCMKRLKGHKKIMITGDNILTACHVTQEINMEEEKQKVSKYYMYGGKEEFEKNKNKWLQKIFNNEKIHGTTTLKDYLKNYHFNLVDECPLSSIPLETLKNCPVYSEKTTNCPFLSKPKQKVEMHIQRCPLKKSLVDTYNTTGTSTSSVTKEKDENKKQNEFFRNSYKKFIEECPVNSDIKLGKGKCPLNRSNPDLSTYMTNEQLSNLMGNKKNKKKGCPITYCKRVLSNVYYKIVKVLFPSFYHTYVHPETTVEEEESYSEQNFGILTYHKGKFTWKRRDGEDYFPNSTNEQIIQNMYRLLPNHKLCMTGTTLEYLILNTKDTQGTMEDNTLGTKLTTQQEESTGYAENDNTNNIKNTNQGNQTPVLKNWNMNNTLLVITNCTVFARMSPQQKEFIIKCFKLNNKIVAMCGDGTNDIAALKQAHVGLSLINTIKPQKNKEVTKKTDLDKLRRGLGEELPSIKLGEASIASPFTYHGSDVNCVFNLVKSGRCALSNVFMLYKLMGINSLITALGMSILALDGVNFSDAQTTLYSILYTYLVLALSKSKPSDMPSEKKPPRSIFSPSNFLSLALQILVHSFFLILVWNLGKGYRSPDYKGYLDAPFEPNIVNTLIYYVWYGINLSSFLTNYIDYPYMESITTNGYLYKPIVLSYAVLLLFVSDAVQPLNKFFSLVPIESYLLKAQVLGIVSLDLVLTYVFSKLINYLFT